MKVSSSQSPFFFTLIPMLAWVLSWISLKYVLPTFPSLLHDLGGDHAELKLSIILFLALFALSQPVWGVLSEFLGRKKILLLCTVLLMIGTLIIIFSHNMFFYLLGRSLEGVGGGGLSPVARAVYVDVFDRQSIARKISVASGLCSLMPAVSPIIAGYIILFAGWRWVFVSFLLVTVLLWLFMLWKLKETRSDEQKYHPKHLPKHFLSIIIHPRFFAFALAYTLMSGGLLAYYAATPFWYVFHFHMSTHLFSYLSLFPAAFYIVGLAISRHYISRVDFDRLLFISVLLAVCCLALLFVAIVFFEASPIVCIVLFSVLFGFSAGFMMPLTNSGGMVIFPALGGLVSSVMTLSIYGGSSLLSWITMEINPSRVWLVLLYFASASVLTVLLLLIFVLIPSWVKQRKA